MQITANGIPQVKEWLHSIAVGVRDVASRAFAEYIVGDATHGLRHEPSYKYVNRYAGFPGEEFVTSTGKVVPGYVSQKQFNYVHAMIAKGITRPGQDNRTHALANSFTYIAQGGNYKITTDNPAAPFVVGGQQTRMHQLIGWRQMWQTAQDNAAGAYRAAQAAVNEWLRSHK
jgi:hypothetical protein